MVTRSATRDKTSGSEGKMEEEEEDDASVPQNIREIKATSRSSIRTYVGVINNSSLIKMKFNAGLSFMMEQPQLLRVRLDATGRWSRPLSVPTCQWWEA